MFDWQAVIVLIIVATAATYVSWRLWLSLKSPGKSSCGSCKSCGPSDDSLSQKVLVTLDDGPSKRRDGT